MPSLKAKHEPMTKAERKALKDFLKAKGLKQQHLDTIPDDGTESRDAIAAKLTRMCQLAPKKV